MSAPSPSPSIVCNQTADVAIQLVVNLLCFLFGCGVTSIGLFVYLRTKTANKTDTRSPSPSQKIIPQSKQNNRRESMWNNKVHKHFEDMPRVALARLTRQDTTRGMLKYQAKVAFRVHRAHEEANKSFESIAKHKENTKANARVAKVRLYDRLLRRTEEHQRELEKEAVEREKEMREQKERKEWRKSIVQAQLVGEFGSELKRYTQQQKEIKGTEKETNTKIRTEETKEVKKVQDLKITKKEKKIAIDIKRALRNYGMAKLGNIRSEFETLSKRALKNMIVYLTGWQMNVYKATAVLKSINKKAQRPTMSKMIFWEDLYFWLEFIEIQTWRVLQDERLVEEKIINGEEINKEEQQMQEKVIANVIVAEKAHTDWVAPDTKEDEEDEEEEEEKEKEKEDATFLKVTIDRQGLLSELRENRRNSTFLKDTVLPRARSMQPKVHETTEREQQQQQERYREHLLEAQNTGRDEKDKIIAQLLSELERTKNEVAQYQNKEYLRRS